MKNFQIEDQLKDQIKSQVFHVRLTNQLSDSILNYFTMSVGLFFYGYRFADIESKKETKSLFYDFIMISGITQIILGIYDWYKRKSLTLLANILYGLLFISWYFKNHLLENKKKDEDDEDKKYESIIYILFIVITLTMVIALKNKGVMYSINYLVMTVGFVFMVVDIFIKKDWAEKVFGYSFIVTAGLFWITGIMRILNNQFLNRTIPFVKE